MANKLKKPNEKRTVRITTLWTENEIKSVGGKPAATQLLAASRDKAYIESIEVKF